MSDPNPEDQASRIKEALFNGNKIQAIKLYREQTGQGLKESKDAVEKLEDELRISSPGQFKTPAKTGCLSVIVVFVSVVIWKIVS